MNNEKIIKIRKDGDEIVIRVAIKDLAFVVANHPEYPYNVYDMEAFGKAIAHELETYSTQNEVEKGSTHVEEMFENILEQVAEGGHDFIELIELS